ncbi:hypothetical protein CEXT_276681 [Caerostris extrusa]|uniref:Uncharacterized protein n=1 Tax=Caerostris extrusa TaxID=172846 RepID=A0AAV4XC05_CAEEX|nr:hypothetical protein CEXT_276681 [Caerostris extrusa]
MISVSSVQTLYVDKLPSVRVLVLMKDRSQTGRKFRATVFRCFMAVQRKADSSHVEYFLTLSFSQEISIIHLRLHKNDPQVIAFTVDFTHAIKASAIKCELTDSAAVQRT